MLQCLCALLLSYFKEYGWFCGLKVKWNAFTNMQFKNIGAKVFFIDTIFIEGPMVPCNFSPFHLLRRLTQEHETELWADRCTCWVALSMQTLFLCYKTELDRGMSFPQPDVVCQLASWIYTRVVREEKKLHGPLECGTDDLLPRLDLVIYTNTVPYLLAPSWVLIRCCSPSRLVVLWNLD